MCIMKKKSTYISKSILFFSIIFMNLILSSLKIDTLQENPNSVDTISHLRESSTAFE